MRLFQLTITFIFFINIILINSCGNISFSKLSKTEGATSESQNNILPIEEDKEPTINDNNLPSSEPKNQIGQLYIALQFPDQSARKSFVLEREPKEDIAINRIVVRYTLASETTGIGSEEQFNLNEEIINRDDKVSNLYYINKYRQISFGDWKIKISVYLDSIDNNSLLFTGESDKFTIDSTDLKTVIVILNQVYQASNLVNSNNTGSLNVNVKVNSTPEFKFINILPVIYKGEGQNYQYIFDYEAPTYGYKTKYIISDPNDYFYFYIEASDENIDAALTITYQFCKSDYSECLDEQYLPVKNISIIGTDKRVYVDYVSATSYINSMLSDSSFGVGLSTYKLKLKVTDETGLYSDCVLDIDFIGSSKQ